MRKTTDEVCTIKPIIKPSEAKTPSKRVDDKREFFSLSSALTCFEAKKTMGSFVSIKTVVD